MKNSIKKALLNEMQNVRMSDELKQRILSEASNERFQPKNKSILPALAVAAALIFVVGLSSFLMTRKDSLPDNVQHLKKNVTASGEWVWVLEETPFYHIDEACSAVTDADGILRTDVRKITLEEAKAEEKEPCALCVPVVLESATPLPTEKAWNGGDASDRNTLEPEVREVIPTPTGLKGKGALIAEPTPATEEAQRITTTGQPDQSASLSQTNAEALPTPTGQLAYDERLAVFNLPAPGSVEEFNPVPTEALSEVAPTPTEALSVITPVPTEALPEEGPQPTVQLQTQEVEDIPIFDIDEPLQDGSLDLNVQVRRIGCYYEIVLEYTKNAVFQALKTSDEIIGKNRIGDSEAEALMSALTDADRERVERFIGSDWQYVYQYRAFEANVDPKQSGVTGDWTQIFIQTETVGAIKRTVYLLETDPEANLNTMDLRLTVSETNFCVDSSGNFYTQENGPIQYVPFTLKRLDETDAEGDGLNPKAQDADGGVYAMKALLEEPSDIDMSTREYISVPVRQMDTEIVEQPIDEIVTLSTVDFGSRIYTVQSSHVHNAYIAALLQHVNASDASGKEYIVFLNREASNVEFLEDESELSFTIRDMEYDVNLEDMSSKRIIAGSGCWWTIPGDAFYHGSHDCETLLKAKYKEDSKETSDVYEHGDIMDYSNAAIALLGRGPCPDCVDLCYFTQGGMFFHSFDICSGMLNATSGTYQEAVALGKSPCPSCISGVWGTPKGMYYHADPTCSGMVNAISMTENTALAKGKTPCPNCFQSVWTTKEGVYYHTKPSCSGMTDAIAMTERGANEIGKKPCPVCTELGAAVIAASVDDASAEMQVNILDFDEEVG